MATDYLQQFPSRSGAGTSLVVQWLRLHAPNAGDPGLIPGQGTRSHMPQLKDPTCRKDGPASGNEDPVCR